jgi:16S rRNA U1498 N3-methylase RsmE
MLETLRKRNMVAVIMPADVADRLKERIQTLVNVHDAVVKFADEMKIRIVFSEDEKKTFASPGERAVVLALKDKDALDAIIPMTEGGLTNYLPVNSKRARQRLDPFYVPGPSAP